MLIALTGATGFVGRAVTASLREAGYKVRALVRAGSQAQQTVETVAGSLEDEEALKRLTAGADAAIHLAGIISALRREQYFEANEEGTRRLVQAAEKAGVKRLVHVSSLSARRPELSAYGASKAAGEAVAAQHSGSMNLLVIRPPAVYGPGDKATLPLIKAFTGNPVVLAGNRASRFSLIHVADLARILSEAVASERQGVLEVDDGKPGGYSWGELVAEAAQVQGRGLKPYFLPKGMCMGFAALVEIAARLRGKPGMVSRDKIRELYAEDWVAQPPGWPLASPIRFRQGFAMTLQWYREAGWLPRPDKAIVAADQRYEPTND